MSPRVIVQGAFDDLRSSDFRFLEEASRLGLVLALLLDDAVVERLQGSRPKFPAPERLYLLQSLRFVHETRLLHSLGTPDALPPDLPSGASIWAVPAVECNPAKSSHAASRGLTLHAVPTAVTKDFPQPGTAILPPGPGRKKVIVTGCYDWFHSGHVRFFEEVSTYGDLYVVVGHDANIRLLKGAGHPLIPEQERRYVVGSVRFVRQALVSTGTGWLDAEPEIDRLQPDIYAVNEDGDKGGKREFCAGRGIEYLVLKRLPAPGLPSRSSTLLRGF